MLRVEGRATGERSVQQRHSSYQQSCFDLGETMGVANLTEDVAVTIRSSELARVEGKDSKTHPDVVGLRGSPESAQADSTLRFRSCLEGTLSRESCCRYPGRSFSHVMGHHGDGPKEAQDGREAVQAGRVAVL